jgi:DNA-binding CsgD family transcriptional regulator
MRLPEGGEHAAAEIAGIAAMPGRPSERAQALLEPLHRLAPFDAAWITLLDPERRLQPALVRRGYDDRVKRYLDGPGLVDDLELIGLHRCRPPMRVKDLPVPEVPVWAEYLHPAGFGEGIAVPLTTADGRYLGLFSAHTETSNATSDATCDLLAQLAPLIAHAVDPLRSITALAALVTDAVAGAVLTRGGAVIPLPGLPKHRLLAAGSPVLTAAVAGLAGSALHAVFLCPQPHPRTAPRWMQVTVLARPPEPPGYLRAAVLLSPPPDRHGLTQRELEVLGLLVEGWSNARIAAALVVAERTAAAHVERILVKLNAASRTMAAVRALRQGLYIPAELARRTPRFVGAQ